ncbi:hypothetical protein AQ918_21140 [Burkholderia pseudomallei]|nr:hypothetical protein AQ918_21140 [Burkholderia pseudomallei]
MDAPGPAASVPLRTAMRRASATHATARLARSRRRHTRQPPPPLDAQQIDANASICCTNLNDFGE